MRLITAFREAIACSTGVPLCVAAAIVLVAGCTQTDSIAGYGSSEWMPRSYADTSARMEEGSDLRWSPRGGAVFFIGGEKEVAPRATVGAYTRMLETDSRRIELALEIAPTFEDPSRQNLYLATTGDYVFFLGEGTFFMKVGGGCAFELRDERQYVLGLLECGGGVWLPVGDDHALVINAMVQVPVGDANPSVLATLSAGYEF